MCDFKYDVIVLGGGVAGLSASIYASRAGLSVLLIETDAIGGKLNYYENIENYPGFINSNTSNLIADMEKQALNSGVIISEYEEIQRVELNNDIKKVITQENGYKDGLIYSSKAIIIATGSMPKRLYVKNEEKFIYNGIHFCAICDGNLYKNKTVAVVGGGNSALEEALYLSNIAKTVYIIHRRDKFRADKVIQDKIKNKKNIVCVMNSEIKEYIGDEQLNGVALNNNTALKLDGLFLYIGDEPNTFLFKSSKLNFSNGYIITDENMKTNINGVYAVGDIRDKQVRQVATAVSDGVIAGISVGKYLGE